MVIQAFSCHTLINKASTLNKTRIHCNSRVQSIEFSGISPRESIHYQLWVLLACFWSHTISAIVFNIIQTFRLVVLFSTVKSVNLRTE